MDYSLETFETFFAEFGIKFDPKLHTISVDMCKKHYLDPENYCESWIAYRLTNQKDQEMNVSSLDAFDRYLTEKTTKIHETPKTNKMIRNNFSSPYTPNSAKKRPRSPQDKGSESKRRLISHNDQMTGTPVRGLPDENTPSGKYSSRKNKGQIVISNLDGKRKDWGRSLGFNEPQVKSVGTEMTLDNFKYMFLSDGDKVSGLNQMILNVKEKVEDFKNISEMSKIGVVFQEPRVVVGRICVDGDKQVKLEEAGSGVVLPLNLESLEEFFFFPGQIVVLECTNVTGKCLKVLKVHEMSSSLPKYNGSQDLSFVVASGPFSTGDVVFEPLADLLKYLENNTPDVCILFGPFIDWTLAEEKYEEDFESLQETIFNNLSETAERLNFKFVIVPSQRDFLHEPVYPQPPFAKFSPNVICLPDPCSLNTEGLVIGATSTDILFHLNKEVISKANMNINRVSKLAQCLLNQQNYYPLYPPSLDVNLDLEAFRKFGKMEVLPHILIAPSELSCFIKSIDGTTFINPGRLAKMQAGGTFCRIFVQHGDDCPLVEAEIVRI